MHDATSIAYFLLKSWLSLSRESGCLKERHFAIASYLQLLRWTILVGKVGSPQRLRALRGVGMASSKKSPRRLTLSSLHFLTACNAM